MALFVTFAINGTIGMALTYALITALIVSLLMTLFVLKRIKVSSALDRYAASKGDAVLLEIILENSSVLPAPLIEAEIESTAHFAFEGERIIRGAVTGKGANTLRFSMTAVHSGKAHIKIRSIKLTDFLGIFSFNLPYDTEELTAAIYPMVSDLSVSTNIMKTGSQFSSNDDEEESEETSSIPTGLAGYDHREYIPGDPLKRVNWKLSSKRDVLMVRLDERIRGSGRVFLLDCPLTDEDDEALTIRDNVIEGALAVLCSLLAEGREASFFYCKQGLLMSIEIHNMQDVYALQEELSDFEPCDTAAVLSSQNTEFSKTPICFTSAMNGNSASAEYIVSRWPDTMIIASAGASLPTITSNMWTLSDTFELSKV